MNNSQMIKSSQRSKYDEMIEYLEDDNKYWLENDVWNTDDEVFKNSKLSIEYKVGLKRINLDFIENEILKNEIKYYLVYSLKNKYFTLAGVLNQTQYAIKYLVEYIETYSFESTFKNISIDNNKWKLFLINKGLKLNRHKEICNTIYRYANNTISEFIKNFYDDREETEKDVWYSKNIEGAKIPASVASSGAINFDRIPIYYRSTVKRYFKTIITKKSWSHCCEILNVLNYFFVNFYLKGYNEGFLEKLSRQDIENYSYWMLSEHKDKNATYRSKFISYIRTFLEYIQMAQYDKAPKKEVAFLIFQDDIPRRELVKDEIKRVKFIPEPILKQLDNSITELDRPHYVPMYILLRETGWRGTDILNLRYDNCLEQIWNKKEESFNYYLCGEITKTGIAQLKIPIRDKVAKMVCKTIEDTKELSSRENNPKKYLFNTYEGKLKGRPLAKYTLLNSIKRLIMQKDIRNSEGGLYHFRMHSLRHTRAREYVEQGMGISIIQQILGHQSLQMTVHYATVSENALYEKWKKTEDLDLFRINTETNNLETVDLRAKENKNYIRFEYVKKNLDAVRVPFGICFKASKVPCKRQSKHCLTCASFCTTTENIREYEEEIARVRRQIEISNQYDRAMWVEKNQSYLGVLELTLEKIRQQENVHKNSKSREEA